MNIQENTANMVNTMRTVYDLKGYVFLEDRIYLPNIMAVRASDVNSNEFNDIGVCAYKNIYKKWCVDIFEMTTDPGIYYRKNTLNSAGTGILAEQQIIDGFRIGKHKGKLALVQNKPFLVYRDNNKDEKLNFDNVVWGNIDCGFNFHRANNSGVNIKKNVGKSSAGCQVVMCISKFNMIMDVCLLAKKYNGITAFNYVLVGEKVFNDVRS